ASVYVCVWVRDDNCGEVRRCAQTGEVVAQVMTLCLWGWESTWQAQSTASVIHNHARHHTHTDNHSHTHRHTHTHTHTHTDTQTHTHTHTHSHRHRHRHTHTHTHTHFPLKASR